MKHTLLALTLSLASVAPLNSAAAQDTRVYDAQVAFTAEQLDNLVAPIALYPDPILAQALIAATFPDQIALAVRHVRAYGTRNIDEQPWDVSVKSIAHYPPVLNLLNDREDWTVALGQAYAEQSGEVMDAVQRLRAMARAQGNLNTTPEQTVIVEPRVIRIVPANPRYIYVPTYDYEYVYYRPIFFSAAYHTRYWSFGIGFPIGSWLIYDCDWRYRRVYYDGWYGGGWRVHSRPFININVVYVQPRHRVVYVNRTVVHRYVNYDNVRRYNTVHRTVTYDNRRRGGGPGPLPRGTAGRDDDRRGGDNRGGDNRGGDNRGGDNRGGDNRGGDNRGGDNRGGDNRGGDDRRDVGTRTATPVTRAEPRSWEPSRVPTAQPRRGEARPVAVTPQSRPQSWEPTGRPSRTVDAKPGVVTRSSPVTRAPSPTYSRPNAPRVETRTAPRVETRSAPVTRAPSGTIYARPSAPPQSNRGSNSSVSRGSVSRSPVSRPSAGGGNGGGSARSAPARSSGSAGPSRSSSGSSGSSGPSRSSGRTAVSKGRTKN